MLQDYSEGTHTPVKLVHSLLLHQSLKPDTQSEVLEKVESASSALLHVYVDTLTTW